MSSLPVRSNTGMTWWAIGLAIIFAGWFISVLFYQFDDLPQPRGDVAEYFMPEMITFTRFLSNMMFISLRHLAGPGNNSALFYAVNALFSLLLVGVCCWSARRMYHVTTGAIYVVLLCTSDLFLAMAYGFASYQIYGLVSFITGTCLFCHSRRRFAAALSGFAVLGAVLFHSTYFPLAAVWFFLIFLSVLLKIYPDNFDHRQRFIWSFAFFVLPLALLIQLMPVTILQDAVEEITYHLAMPQLFVRVTILQDAVGTTGPNMAGGSAHTAAIDVEFFILLIRLVEGTCRTVALVILFMAGLGSLLSRRSDCRAVKALLVHGLLPLLTYLLMVSFSVTKLARTYFFVYPFFLFICAVGLRRIIQFVHNRCRVLTPLLLITCLVCLVVPGLVRQWQTREAFHLSRRLRQVATGPAMICLGVARDFMPVSHTVPVRVLSFAEIRQQPGNQQLLYHRFSEVNQCRSLQENIAAARLADRIAPQRRYAGVQSLPLFIFQNESFISLWLSGKIPSGTTTINLIDVAGYLAGRQALSDLPPA